MALIIPLVPYIVIPVPTEEIPLTLESVAENSAIVPNDVNEEIVTPLPSVSDETTSVPLIL